MTLKKEKWPSIIAILIGAITGFILINILTGGALMLALPFLIQAIGVIFAGVGIYGMLSHFKNYLSSSWAGKIVKGGKHLARALAMLAIEAVFALMFGGKAAFKAVKSGAKSIAKNGVKASLKSGAKLAKTTAKNGLKSGVQGAKRFKRIVGAGTQRAGKNLAKGGKFMVSGVRKGAMKGAKSLKSVVKNLSKKLKFDKYRFTLKGRKFKLEGHLNPWVLFANGEVKHYDHKDLKGKKIGEDVDGGILVGKMDKNGKGSHFVNDYLTTGKSANDTKIIREKATNKFKELKGDDLEVRKAKISVGGKGVPRNPKFRENYFKFLENSHGVILSPLAKRFISIHHIIPNFIKGVDGIDDLLILLKKNKSFDIDELINGIALPTTNLDDLLKRINQLKKSDASDITKEFGIKGKVSSAELKKAIEELEDFKNKSIHDNYHNKYSKIVKDKIVSIAANYRRNSKNQKNANKAGDLAVTQFNKLYNTLKSNLESGKILE